VSPDPVPFLDLRSQQAEILDEVLPQVTEILRSGAFVGGPHVEAFEHEYAGFAGVGHCVGLANGTDAVELSLRAVGVGAGDEVIVPANTFVATVEAVARIGAEPVLVDVDAEALLIDPDCVSLALTPRTRAVVPVHLYGQMAPVERIREVLDGRDVAVVEDAAPVAGSLTLRRALGRGGRHRRNQLLPRQEPRRSG